MMYAASTGVWQIFGAAEYHEKVEEDPEGDVTMRMHWEKDSGALSRYETVWSGKLRIRFY